MNDHKLPLILMRDDDDISKLSDEIMACYKAGFPIYKYRDSIPKNSIVVGRYSVLPYYNELQRELVLFKNSTLINSIEQHNRIALSFYYHDLSNLITPQTWFESEFYLIPEDENTHYIVKGCTTSKKFEWNTKMYAKTKREALEIASELKRDLYIGTQELIIKRYIPLQKYEEGLNGLPITNEWRFFCYKDKILSYGYYWSIAENAEKYNIIEQSCLDFVHSILYKTKEIANFYSLDVAKTENGRWIIIEMNDGQMSGLSMNDPYILYKNLYTELIKDGNINE